LLEQEEYNAIQLLKEASIQLQQLEKYQPEIGDLTERLRSSIIEIKDISSEISNLEQTTFFNEERNIEINDRLYLLYSLQKKHRGCSNTELIALQDELSQKLNNAIFIDEDILALEKEIAKEKDILIKEALELSAKRQKAIPQIQEYVEKVLSNIGMPDAQLRVDIHVRENDQFDINGLAIVEFMFTANKGHQLNELHKV